MTKYLIILLGFLFVSCSAEEEEESEFQQIVEANREPADISDLEAFMPDFSDTEIEELTESEVEETTIFRETEDMVSPSSMEEDAETLLRLFRYTYGPYEYYGGDEAFLSAHNDILQWMEDAQEERSVTDFKDALRNAYGFVDDQHLWIGDQRPAEETFHVYFYENLLLEKREEKYYDGDNEILAINDENPEDHLLPTANEAGELRYMPGTYETSSGGKWTIESEDGTETIILSRSGRGNPAADILVDEVTEDQIAVIGLGTMLLNEPADVSYEEMLASAETLENADAAILDLRSNTGGLSGFVLKWLDLAMGGPKSSTESIETYTDTTNQLISHMIEVAESERLIWEEFYEGMGEAPAASFYNHEEDRRPYAEKQHPFENTEVEPVESWENEKPVYILTNELTGSAAEWMTAELLEAENVYVVGLPTAGMAISDMGFALTLPNSGISLQLPTSFVAHPYTFDRVNKGIEPDLWVNDADALEYTLAWIRNTHLNHEKK